MKRKLILAVLVFVTGCATIVHGPSKSIRVTTEPAGATASINGQEVTTPGSVEVERDRTYVVIVKKPGYETQTVEIKKAFNPWILGNLLFVPAVIVDVITGSFWELEPGQIYLELEAD